MDHGLVSLRQHSIFRLKILSRMGDKLRVAGMIDSFYPDNDLHQLQQISGSAFEAVDESALQMIPDSARADPTRVVSLPGGFGLGLGLIP